METLMTVEKEAMYSKSFTCPVCEEKFTSRKVRTSAIRTLSRDTDFYTKYAGDDPTWYEVLVCPSCGYSAFEGSFQDISIAQKAMLEKTVRPKWKQRDFGGERTIIQAIEAHTLAMICCQVIAVKKTTVGKLCLRLAWLYRTLNDQKEFAFMEYAVRNLEEAYTSERLDEDKANEINVMYLLGELNRRLGRFTEASRWFSLLIADPELKKIRHMNIKVREQMSQTREDNSRAKAASQ